MIHEGRARRRDDAQPAAAKPPAADYYRILGVAHSASTAQIRLAYRRLALKHHPDVSTDQAAAEDKLREINEAYNVLRDRRKRIHYDRFGHTAAAANGAESVARVFDLFFGPARSRASAAPGNDLRCDVEVGADELATGTSRELSFRDTAVCGICAGSGAKPGTPIAACDRCSGSGTMRAVRRTPHSVHLTQAPCTLCGGKGQMVRTPCGTCRGRGTAGCEKMLSVLIPAGTADAVPIRIEAAGGAGCGGGPPGDLYVHIAVKGAPAMRPAPSIRLAEGTAARRDAIARDADPAVRSAFALRRLWISLIAALAIVSSGAVFLAVHRGAAVTAAEGGTVDVCATPGMKRFAADLIRGYTMKSSQRSFVVGDDLEACDIRLSAIPGTSGTAVARDAVVAIVNPLNPVERISEAQLRAIFGGSVHDWADLGGPHGAIVPFMPDAASDEARAIEASLFSGLPIDSGVIRRRSSADVTRAVARADRVGRDAIGLVTFSQAVAAKILPLAYLPPPNALTIASRHYPLTLTLTLHPESQRDPAATQQLVDFARSPDGLAIVEKDGLVAPRGL